jgi:hypothetical protein
VIERYTFQTGTNPTISAAITANGPVDLKSVPQEVQALCKILPDVESVVIIRNTEQGRYIHIYSPIKEAPSSESQSAPDRRA